ncbi:hypothetical protein [Aurantimonas sp. VKM B-3413]|uniref:hypothetical protein n=1 Tax=Aurantimonas sp. VKM B-3413 TaxID=2779401 RepID=UPI001E63D507|nr:hypothetical protein [Aurantimonas sp. VKM B-3413]MCB8838976.1 hypothetical protein [Aurantimonas sp. VKM B-3413]
MPLKPVAAATEDPDDPAAKILSVVDGDGRTAKFSRLDLAQLPQTRFVTAAPFLKTPTPLEGPSVSQLLRAFDPDRTFHRIEIVALDSYLVSADISQLEADGAILAIRQDGAFLPIAEKGPAYLVFPFDDRPSLKDKSHYGLCIWQISQIRLS